MRRLVLLALLVVSSTLGAQTLTQTIRGTVVDSESKSPLPDAMLICDNVQAFSDEYGQFEMDVEIVAARLWQFNSSVMSLLPCCCRIKLCEASRNSHRHDRKHRKA